jgi:gas vesicle protein
MARRDEYDDERVVVVEQGGASGVGMLLLGLAIGAGAALLFAPASGEETRDRLQREARRAGRKIKDMADDVGDGLTSRVERTKSRFDAQVERARQAVRSQADAVGDAVDAGREAAAQARTELERAVAESKRAYADSRRAYREARRQATHEMHSATDGARHHDGARQHDDLPHAGTVRADGVEAHRGEPSVGDEAADIGPRHS